MLVYEKLDENGREHIRNLWAKELSEEDEVWIRMQMQKHNIISQSIDEAKIFANKALMAVVNENNTKLQEIITQMVERTF